MGSPESPEAERIKALVGGLFGAVAPDYDQSGVDFFGQFARHLVDRLTPEPGWHVVDIGAGRGAVAFPLADAVGPGGRVTAVDLAEPMVRALQDDATSRGITTVEAVVGDVDSLHLADGTADAVTASMMLFFLPEPGRGLRSIQRVLRPGGRLGFTVFGAADPRWQPVYDAFAPFLPDPRPGVDRSRPRHPELSSPERLRAHVGAAGFVDVQVETQTHAVRFASIEQWHTWSWSIGLRGTWLQIPEERRPAAVDAVLAEVEARRRPDGSLIEDFEVRYVLATSPAGVSRPAPGASP